ncbi:uncharacterized protein LOC119846889 [Dermochelys coriacea]|uniref:uncharacterized protein LOC119846889 n=1 Tax=Dermochelys coriacea TaxID=27794 RepID=UPI001CAA02A1|nr:uncharacterized protein LOC119846889 [Dermochelys coriacea]
MEPSEIGSARPVGGFGAGPGPDAAGMGPERSGSAPLPCTLQPVREPGFVPLPFFFRHDSPMSWDLCDPIPAAESPGSWESSLQWDGGSLVIANSSQGQPGTPGGVGSISPQPPLDLSGFPLAEPWDGLLPDAPADAAPDFVHPLVMAAHLDPSVPWLMSRINPAGFTSTPPPLDPASFPLPELWNGPHMDAPPAAAPDPTLPPVAAACLDPTDRHPTSKTNPVEAPGETGFTPTPPPLDPAGFPLPELWTGPHIDAPPAAAPDPTLPPVAAACLDPTDGPPTSKTNPDLAEVSAYVSQTLSCHPKGMRVKPLMKRLLKERGVDLLAFSQDGGYQGVVSFLQEVPGIELWNPEKGEKCCVLSCTFKKSAAVKLPAPQPPPDPPAAPSAQHSSSPPPNAPAPPLQSADGEPGGAPGETPGLAEVLAWVQDVLGRFPLGLKVGKLKEALRSERGLDLEELSRQRGCGDALHLLRALPHLWLGDPGKGDACLARLSAGAAVKLPAPQPPPDPPAAPSAQHSSSPPPNAPAPPLQSADGEPGGAPGETPGLAEVLAWVRDVLGRFPLGLKVGKLKEALRSERGLDLEELSRQRGCGDALHLLRALPHLWLGDPGKGDACLARLSADTAVNAPVPPAPSRPAEAGGLGAAGPARRMRGQRWVAKPGAMETLIRGALAPCPFGMRVKSLKKLLAGKHGAKLEAFSQARGYRDVVSFLGDVPGLMLRDPEKGNNCVVQLQRGATEVLRLLKCLLRPYKSGLRLQKVQELLLERHRLDLKRFVSSQGEEDVLGFLQRRLPALEYRQAEKGENCIVWLGTGQKKGSGSLPPDSARPLLGSKRCLLPTNAAVRPAPPATDCLNPRLPSATTNRPLLPSLPSGREPFRAPAVLGKLGKSPGANPRLPAWLLSPPRPTGTCSGLRALKGTQESGARPASVPLALRAEEGTQEPGARLASAPLALRAEEGTQEPGARPASAPLALRAEEGTQEPGARPASAPLALRAEEGTQEPGARPASAPLALRAEEGTQESGARPASAPLALRAEEGTQESGAQPPEDLRELKQKVVAILAGHPGGMSLFQFRAAYSAAHQHPLPLGRTASTKQRLAQMPDVVRMQGCGVQMLLLPVDPNGPPGGEPGLALWIPQEAAVLSGDPDDPSDPPPSPAVPDPAGDSHVPAKPCSTLSEIPAAPILTGDPRTPAESPPLPAAPSLTAAPDTPAEPLPSLAEISPVLTAPDQAGDTKVPIKPPPTFVAPRQGPSSQAFQCPEATRPEASWELPNLVPSAPVVLPASGPGSSSWFKLGAESPPTPGDPGAAARPVVYPPPQEVPLAPAADSELPSLCPAALGPPQARLKRVQLVPPFQDHPSAGDAPQAHPVLKTLGQNQGTSAAVGSPVGPIPADPSTGQAISPAKQLPVVAPDPLPPPDASVLATPDQGWPETGPGGDIGSPVDPLWRCSPTQLVPSAGRTQPGPCGEIPSAPPAHSPPRNTDTCIFL